MWRRTETTKKEFERRVGTIFLRDICSFGGFRRPHRRRYKHETRSVQPMHETAVAPPMHRTKDRLETLSEACFCPVRLSCYSSKKVYRSGQTRQRSNKWKCRMSETRYPDINIVDRIDDRNRIPRYRRTMDIGNTCFDIQYFHLSDRHPILPDLYTFPTTCYIGRTRPPVDNSVVISEHRVFCVMYEQWPSGLKMFRQSDDKKVVKHICYEFLREIGIKTFWQ